MIRKPRILIGGPSYDGRELHERAAHIADIATNLTIGGMEPVVFHSVRSFVGYGRADMLQKAVDDGFDVLISMDTDTWWSPQSQQDMSFWQSVFSLVLGSSLIRTTEGRDVILERMNVNETDIKSFQTQRDLAILSYVVACRDGRVNAWETVGKRIGMDYFAQSPIRNVHAVGLAYAFFNVAWYRSHRDSIRAFDMEVDGAAEDYGHCKAVRNAGGTLLAALGPTFHRPSTGGVTLTCGLPPSPAA
jgi:hypothetical protein